MGILEVRSATTLTTFSSVCRNVDVSLSLTFVCHGETIPGAVSDFCCVFAAQISRLLVLEPAARLTAEQALAHPFFRLYQKEGVRLFSPRKTFRVGQLFKQQLLQQLFWMFSSENQFFAFTSCRILSS